VTLDKLSLNLLPSTSSQTSTDLLSAIYGTSTGGVTGNPIAALQLALKTETKSVAAVAKQPETARDIAAFRAAVAKAKTPAELLANPVARKVLLTANGLGDQTDYAALASKALLSDTSKTGSLASKLTDTRWLSVAKTYDFANQGLSLLKKSGVLDTLANGYAEVSWRQSLDTATPGLSNALDFRSRAGTIKTADQILGDKTMREVVTVALGIPKQIAFQSLQAQENAITSRLDVTKFKSASFVDQFTKRYLVAAGQAAATSTSTTITSATTGLASLFA
jgi:hypothetical protein